MADEPPDPGNEPTDEIQSADAQNLRTDAPIEPGVEHEVHDTPVVQAAEPDDGAARRDVGGSEGVGHDGQDDDEYDEDDDEEEDEDEDEDDEEPQLKYARLTKHLGPVYRNGDATSAFVVAGDKMVVGTHNGVIHVVQLPTFRSLRAYQAHTASVTAVSISPYPPPITSLKPDAAARIAAEAASGNSPGRPSSESQHSGSGFSPAPSRQRQPKEREVPTVPNVPSNNIYIATSSMDGNVCVQSLIDLKDVQLRIFARPVQAVALSPEYKSDRTYLSGGLAGSLILTVGGQPGRSKSTTTGQAAAVASGWLGNMGLGPNTGKDTVLHSGEGTISTIKWSLSGRYAVWLNEHGIKIIRTGLHLDTNSGGAEDAWKRLGHIDRPQTEEWNTMASVWRGRAEWIDEKAIESDVAGKERAAVTPSPSPAAEKLKQQQKEIKKLERLVVGWGSRIWMIHVHPGGIGVGRHAGERTVGRAEIVNILNMDCIISGISLYTQTLLLVLAYITPDDEEEEEEEKEKQSTSKGHKSKLSTASRESEPSGGIRKRQNNLPPELRLIDLSSQSEVSKDGLSVSRYERLSASDYHLGILAAQTAASAVASRGAFEALAGFGSEMWNAAINPRALFSSGASVKSRDSNDGASGSKAAGSTSGSVARQGQQRSLPTVDPSLAKPGVKVFIHSPYDCILATKRDLADHLSWLLERQQYQSAWELVDEHPEIMSVPREPSDIPTGSGTPDRGQGQTQASDDFYDDSASVADTATNKFYSSAEKEKRRIGELWVQELVEAGDWTRAGRVCGKVLGSADRWEKWVWTFAGADKFDEIADAIPTEVLKPPIPGTIYEVVLGHYLQHDKLRFRDLLDRWSPDLFDINTVTTALENQLKYRDVREDSVEDGEKGRDWRIVMEGLAKLHEANGRTREALKCYIRLQDADSAMRLIKESHLADAVADDIPSFIALRVPNGHADSMTSQELEDATAEAITLLVDEAQHGLVKPDLVISQLQAKSLDRYTFFYLRGLLKGEGIKEHLGETHDRLVLESRSLVDDFADLAVRLLAAFDRALLMDFLRSSTSYSIERAVAECEHHAYVPELVYLYSKTGQTKRALYLIIDRLGDVARAIAFAREQDDPDLWEDLLEYSMDKPRFIHGLLDGVGIGIGSGSAIDPVRLVRRIPEGLQIEGLREGLQHLLREHEVQMSISGGAAKILRSEVAVAQALLRGGQRKGIKFEIVLRSEHHVDVQTKDVPTPANGASGLGGLVDGSSQVAATGETPTPSEQQIPHPPSPSKQHPAANGQKPSAGKPAVKKWKPGHCAQCFEPFTEHEVETLVGFACGHVFHLTHLLAYLHPEMMDGDEPPDVDFLLSGTEQTLARRGMRIGSKVTHARLLKDRIEGGCPVCGKVGVK